MAATPNVSFGYNAAGGRTSMTDGLGSVSYGYDQLSRLTSETRTFTGVGSFALTYQYNVAGELTSVTNPWSAQVGYNYDKVGQVTGVTGSGYSGVTSYINSLSYRAFGAAKQINYANGKTLLLQYNNRMWLSRWDLSGILGYDYNYNRYGEGNTGRPDYAHNLYDSTLDRAWTYDPVGRLTSAYTGTEANAIWGNPTGPYAQSFTYDPWGDITARAGWGGANASYAATFNSKNQMLTNPGNGQAFSYDAAGNITYDGGQAFTYDAAGNQVTSSWNGLQQSYDGDGLRGKKVMDGAATYYLHSSVLSAQVVAEINASGGWTRGYVYLGGQMLAIQQSGVTWVHQEPLTKGQRLTDSNGNVTSTIELDPFGGDTSRTVNGANQPHTFTSYERDTTGGMDEAMMRRYHGWWSRFDQPDPYNGSYDWTDPQSFNRYSYTQNDPVNFVDPFGLCTFNINISGLSGQALTDMQNELSRIFQSGNQNVVFGHPELANGGSRNLEVTGQYTGHIADVLHAYGKSTADTRLAGVTESGSDISYVNSAHIFAETNKLTAYRAGVASHGTMYGRVGAHEVITHGFLNSTFEGVVPFDVLVPSNQADLTRIGARFDISAATAAALNKLCPPQTPSTHEAGQSPGGGGLGGIVNPPRPIGVGGLGSNWTIFDWLQLLWHEHVTVTVKPG